MIQYFFKPLFYIPLYNALVFLLSILPAASVGLAVILLTCIVKLILFPLTRQSVVTTAKLKKLEPELAVLRKQYEKDKQEQARQVMAFYKKNQINPFSGVWLLLIQTPIILSLYYIFLKGGLPIIDVSLLYPFIHPPQVVDMTFLGLNIAHPQFIFGLLAGVTQFIQIQLSVPPVKKLADGTTPTFKDDLARSMNMQFRYVLPVVIFIISLKVSGAVALYWATSNLFIIGQELVVRRQLKKTS
ncbi:MAG TPA: YidC/Oxa1 family membrane protein insertase [Candidatus Paceibacterota bacterium]|nr:YidC/Oxa1 family membrane protein insertase [Candidatus Paceibacterota bacterium]